MGQFPSSILGGCECGGGDLAILDSARASHAALDFARPSGSPKSDEVKGFLRGFALAVSCVVSDPTSRP